MKDIYIKAFFDNQDKLFDFPVAEDLEEARDFLENDCETYIFDSFKELKEFLVDEADLEGDITKDNVLSEVYEVFLMPDGKYMYVGT
jgi:uncharacterized protein Yka (UPF0111/DUF47 family)